MERSGVFSFPSLIKLVPQVQESSYNSPPFCRLMIILLFIVKETCTPWCTQIAFKLTFEKNTRANNYIPYKQKGSYLHEIRLPV